MQNIWHTLKQNRFTLARVSVLVFVLFGFVAKSAQAVSVLSIMKITVLDFVGQVGVAFALMAKYFLTVSQSFFQLSLLYNLQFGDKIEIIKIGWGISRDVANVFFIVVLLIIAIATILRISGYAAKQLLASLIIMAVLINFSLTIGTVVVDVSNALGLQFYNAMTDDNTKSISDVIMQGTGLQHTLDFRAKSYEMASQQESLAMTILRRTFSTFGMGSLIPPDLASIIKDSDTAEEKATAFATIAWGDAIFMSVLIFVFFVAAITLLVRVAVISVLLMLAPLAFLFYILPDTKTHWNRWWSELIKHCFFLPAFLFLLYFAIIFILKIAAANAGITGNFIGSPSLVFAYILAIILLLQALIIGRTMGAMGASTAIAWARKGRQMTSAFIGSQTVGRMSERLRSSEKIQDTLRAAPPWIASRVQGWMDKGAAVGGRQKSAERTADYVARKTPGDQAKDFARMSFGEKQALLRKLNTKQREELLNNLSGDQRVLADRILGTSLAADQKADLDASQYQRMQGTDAEKREAFAGLSREAKERVLRTMNQTEQADYTKALRDTKNPNLVAAADVAEDILKKDFAPNQFVAYKVAQFNKEMAATQLARWNSDDPMLDDRTRAAILLGMKDDEREAFLDKIETMAPGERKKAEKVMADYFPPDKLLDAEAARVNAIKDPAEQRAAFLALKNTKAQEAILRKKTDQQRALFVSQISQFNSQKDGEDIEETLHNMLTPSEYAKYEAQMFLLGNKQEQDMIFGDENLLSDLAREEILRQKKDPNAQALFVANLSKASKDKAEKIIDGAFAPDEVAAFKAAAWNLLPPTEQNASFELAQEAVQEKILRSLTGERRAGFLAELNTSQRRIADDIIAKNFSIDERAAIYAEEWKLKMDTDVSKDKMNFFATGNDLAQEKILAGFKDYDEMERFISGLERSTDTNHKGAATKARTLLNSARFTASQRSEFKKAQKKQDVTLADNAGRLYALFNTTPDVKQKAELLEAMNERQQIEMFEEAGKDMASMAVFSDTLRNMKPHLREAFVTKTLSRASNEAVENYFAQKDAEIQANATDTQRQDELRGEKKRAFKGLSGDAKAALWEKAWTEKRVFGSDRGNDEFKRLMTGSTPGEIEAFHRELGTVLGDKIIKSPDDAAEMYDAMDQKARHLYLQSKQGRGIVSQLREHVQSTQPTSSLPTVIDKDFNDAGQKGSPEYRAMQKQSELLSRSLGTSRVSNVAQSVSGAAELATAEQTGAALEASQAVELLKQMQTENIQVMRGSKAIDIDNKVIENIQSGGSNLHIVDGKATMIPNIRGGAPTEQTAQAAPIIISQSAPTTAPAPVAKGSGAGGEGKKNMNQAAVKAARDASRIETEEATLSPKVQNVVDQAVQSPARAIAGYKTLPKQDKSEMMRNAPQSIIAMKDAASDAELSAINNDIQGSTPANIFRFAALKDKSTRLGEMPLNDKRIAFEAMASSNNPQDIKNLRLAIPSDQLQAFADVVVAQGSKASMQTYLKEVVKEKAEAQKTGNTTAVEKLIKEETTITKAIESKTTPPPPTASQLGGQAKVDSVTAIPSTENAGKTVVDAKPKTTLPPPPPPPSSTKISEGNLGGPTQSPTGIDVGKQATLKPSVDTIKPNGINSGVPLPRIHTETSAGARRDVMEKRGELKEDEDVTESAERAIAEQLEKTERERNIEQETMAPKTTAPPPLPTAPAPTQFNASIPQGVGVMANDEVKSAEEISAKWIDDVMAIESGIRSATESSVVEALLKIINAKIASTNGVKTTLETTAGDAGQIQLLKNIVSRYEGLKTEAEAKLQALKNK